MNELWQILMHVDEFLLEITNANVLVAYLVITAIVFLESGNLFFVFLPGDGFLFMVGVVASAGALSIWLVLAIMVLAAIVGYLLNYYTGKYFGRPFLKRSKWIPKKYYRKTFQFFHRHGSKAIILGRFFPIVRTFSPFLAGVGKMSPKTFYRDAILGGIIWIGSFVLIGYFFGGLPFIKENFFLLYLGMVLLTFTPLLIASLKKALSRS